MPQALLLNDNLVAELDAKAAALGQSTDTFATLLLEEGLRLRGISYGGGNGESNAIALYLSRVVSSGEISAEVADRVRKGVSLMAVPHLPPPDMSVQRPDQVLCVWDKAEHHFEVEARGQKPLELFYRNRITGYCWEEEWDEQVSALSDRARAYLAIFVSE